jgi:hypothetical protein
MVEIITATNTASFNADWASPPGDLIEEVLEERGWSRADHGRHRRTAGAGAGPCHGAGFWQKESLRRGSVDPPAEVSKLQGLSS